MHSTSSYCSDYVQGWFHTNLRRYCKYSLDLFESEEVQALFTDIADLGNALSGPIYGLRALTNLYQSHVACAA